MKSHMLLFDKFSDRSCFIVGSGTSLETLDLSLIPNESVVIAINGAVLALSTLDLPPETTFWISNDTSVMNWTFWSNIKEWNCQKIFRSSFIGKVEDDENHFVFDCRDKSKSLQEPQGLCCQSTAPSAIDQAIQMGCSKIFLLGIDHYHINNKAYFFEMNTKKYGKHFCVGRLPGFMQKQCYSSAIDSEYPFLKKFAEERNATIYNCSMNSRINTFKKLSFKEACDLSS